MGLVRVEGKPWYREGKVPLGNERIRALVLRPKSWRMSREGWVFVVGLHINCKLWGWLCWILQPTYGVELLSSEPALPPFPNYPQNMFWQSLHPILKIWRTSIDSSRFSSLFRYLHFQNVFAGLNPFLDTKSTWDFNVKVLVWCRISHPYCLVRQFELSNLFSPLMMRYLVHCFIHSLNRNEVTAR